MFTFNTSAAVHVRDVAWHFLYSTRLAITLRYTTIDLYEHNTHLVRGLFKNVAIKACCACLEFPVHAISLINWGFESTNF